MAESNGVDIAAEAPTERRFWLMKAEPDSRIEKGKDVAFSIDHFEKIGTSHWDGVRNAVAKNYMKNDMRVGDGVLFYHSNTKVPGVAGLAEIVKEGYPDHTAWDPEHPYYDAKSDKDKPKWFMVDVIFKQRLAHLVPLALYKHLASQNELPEELAYLTPEHLEAIKAMPLVTRGRLSVQTVSKLAYDATVLLGENGGFSDLVARTTVKRSQSKRKVADVEDADVESGRRDDADAEQASRPKRVQRQRQQT